MTLQSEERLQRLERLTEIPLFALALFMIPLLALPALTDLSSRIEFWFLVADWIIWAAFALDFGAKLALAPQRLSYIRTHPLDAAMVLLPFLRPLRLLRVLPLARLATALGMNTLILRSFFLGRGTLFVLACLLLAIVGGGTLVFAMERQAESANITTLSDAVWWAFVTMTSVGYGDHTPITPAGRVVAGILMVGGVAALSAVTARIAALMIQERKPEVSLQDVMARLDKIERTIEGKD